ncbi:putative glycosyltransferase YkoT [Bacteroidia bacterium]|nr:putative glycosyltransferase YkoT [Bacteroidia bacterium]
MAKKIYIVTPCYNDWESLSALLTDIDKENEKYAHDLHVVVVNDGSSQENPFEWSKWGGGYKEITQIDLVRNVGHQRAICVALAYINANFADYDGVVVMDCDGEDDYRDVFRFIDDLSADEIIFARRRKRSESLSFRVFYSFYKALFKMLTGHVLQGGNFSLIPSAMLNKVVHLSEIWNHYHAGILKSRLKIKYLDCDRAQRYRGKSKMNFVSLVTHGLSSVSVFNDIVFVKLTLFAILFFIGSLGAIAFVLFLKFVLDRATPGWATTSIGILLILCTQFLFMVINFTFTTLGSRNMHTFMLEREYKSYIMQIKTN